LTHGLADHFRLENHVFMRQLLAECLGTVTFVLFGVGVAAQAYLTMGGFGEMLDVSFGYAAAWVLALFVAGTHSMGLCNPCIAFANCITGRLDFFKMLGYWAAEILGAYIGNLLVIAIYYEKIWDFTNKIDHGVLSMNTTGSIFSSSVNGSPEELIVDQIIVGAITMVGVMAALDVNNWDLPRYLVIAYVAVIEFLLFNDFSLNTTSSINPALDVGGRLAILSAGWGTAAFSYGNYASIIFTFIPFVGTLVGVLIYELLVGIHLPGAGGNPMNNLPLDLETDSEK